MGCMMNEEEMYDEHHIVTNGVDGDEALNDIEYDELMAEPGSNDDDLNISDDEFVVKGEEEMKECTEANIMNINQSEDRLEGLKNDEPGTMDIVGIINEDILEVI